MKHLTFNCSLVTKTEAPWGKGFFSSFVHYFTLLPIRVPDPHLALNKQLFVEWINFISRDFTHKSMDCWFSLKTWQLWFTSMHDVCAQSLSRGQLSSPTDCHPRGSSVHGILSRQEYWSGLHFLLQGIFLTQGSNPRLLHLLHWQVASLSLHDNCLESLFVDGDLSSHSS